MARTGRLFLASTLVAAGQGLSVTSKHAAQFVLAQHRDWIETVSAGIAAAYGFDRDSVGRHCFLSYLNTSSHRRTSASIALPNPRGPTCAWPSKVARVHTLMRPGCGTILCTLTNPHGCVRDWDHAAKQLAVSGTHAATPWNFCLEVSCHRSHTQQRNVKTTSPRAPSTDKNK